MIGGSSSHVNLANNAATSGWAVIETATGSIITPKEVKDMAATAGPKTKVKPDFMSTQTVSLNFKKLSEGGQYSEQSPSLSYGRIQSRF